MMKKLEVKNLQVSFRTQNGLVKAVRDISFDLHAGETFAIVGESGSGKSVTSKSIIGILSGNAVVEGGEIIYDGQDLLKIQEEDFHKLRGDKIAMIFQDPMSSLNPIMKVGKQLTEAMILKAKMSKKNAKNNFNSKLKLLNEYMNKIHGDTPEDIARNNELIKEFDSFAISSIELENRYTDAVSAAIELNLLIDDFMFLLENKQEVDFKKTISSVIKQFDLTKHEYLITENAETISTIQTLDTILLKIKEEQNVELIVKTLKNVHLLLENAMAGETPNYFTLGYYVMKNPDADVTSMRIEELNKMTRQYLDDNFMLEFIRLTGKALVFANNESVEKKKALLPVIKETLTFFETQEMTKKIATAKAVELAKQIKESINNIELVKSSIQYSFKDIMTSSLDRYYNGVKTNPKEEARFNKETEKREQIIAAGKNPNGKVIPAMLIDLELTKKNINTIFTRLIESIDAEVAAVNDFNADTKAVELIDFFKEQTAAVVAKMNAKIAKAKALKLLEEVGIPQPNLRFNQFPFEFSGGMRQRVVIAIALSANPDILICDEPTTALDVTIQSQILDLINRLKVERKLSVIFITHDLGVVASMADRVAVMYAGKIVEYGKLNEIFYEPAHPYTWALLSSMPDLDTKDVLEAIPGTPPNMIYPPVGDAFAARNKYALQIDFEQQPPLFKITDTHYAATWLLHEDAPKVELPAAIKKRADRFKNGGKTAPVKEEVKSSAKVEEVVETPVATEKPVETAPKEAKPTTTKTAAPKTTKAAPKKATTAKPATAKPAEAAPKDTTTKPATVKKVVKKTTTTTTITKKAGGTTTTVVETKESTGGDVNEQ